MHLTFSPARTFIFLFCREGFFIIVRIFLFPWEFFFQRENLSFAMKTFLLLWESFFQSENLSDEARIFLSPWEFLFCCENLSFVWRESFSFSVRIFLFQWDFSFSVITFILLWESFFRCESFSFAGGFFLLLRELYFWKFFLPKAKICGKPYKKSLVCYVAYVQCCKQDPFIFQNIRII